MQHFHNRNKIGTKSSYNSETADSNKGDYNESNWTMTIQQLFAQLWSDKLVLVQKWRWRGVGSAPLPPLFHRTIFIPPSCRRVSLEHGAQNWKGDLKGDLKASLYPRWPLTASQHSEAEVSLLGAHRTTHSAHPGVSPWTCWHFFCCSLDSNTLKSLPSEQTLDRRLQQKLSLDEIRSSMQQRQAITWMEYTAGSQCKLSLVDAEQHPLRTRL